MIDAFSLSKYLEYDHASGDLKWLPRSGKTRGEKVFNKRWAGTIAGSVDSWGHIQVKIEGRLYSAHRLIWAMAGRGWPESDIDHIDGDKANNRLSNLRLTDACGNAQNRPAPKTNSSGFKGVSFHKPTRKWASAITANRSRFYLGLFDTPDAAHAAYVAASHRLHGEFARAA